MRRFTTTLGTLAAAAVLVIGLGGSAQASSGELHLNGFTFHEPHGCFTFGNWTEVANHTDNPAILFANPYCYGPALDVIPPGDTAFVALKRSIYLR